MSKGSLMAKDPDSVRKELRKRVLCGYRPRRSLESAEDFNTDWLALAQDEFDAVLEAALRERSRIRVGKSGPSVS